MPEITVNGEPVEADEGELVFELLRRQDIEVPHFCYHPELSLAGACRMCMVEIDGNVDISCTRRVEDEMEIVTDNEQVEEARRGILEFMLVNHPLDCPVCDKGGECPLQDYTMGYGPAESRFTGNKRTFPKMDLGELLTQRQNRCILCYRCTRFYQEEAGREDFRVIQRGNDAFVGKKPGGQLESELSGNMVDICPTGTIVTKPYLHKSRPWDNEPVESVSAVDPLQTPIIADVQGDEIQRIRPVNDPEFAKPWIDDRVRFMHEYNSDDEHREKLPMDDSYFNRFDQVREEFSEAGDGKTAGVISPDRTLEEQFLFRKLFRNKLGSDFVTTSPDIGGVTVDPIRFEELMESDFILIAGTNFRNEYPMLTPFLRTAARNGATIAYLSYWGSELTIEPDIHMMERPDDLLKRLRRLAEGQGEDVTDQAILDALDEADSPTFVSCEGRSVGSEITRSALNWENNWSYLRLSPGGNSKASELVFPDPPSTSAVLEAVVSGEITHLFVYGMDLLRDFPDRGLVKQALRSAEYVVSADYLCNSFREHVDQVLPLTTQFEEEGTMVNAEGRIRYRPTVTEPDERILTGRQMLSFWVEPGEEGIMATADEILEPIVNSIDALPDMKSEELKNSSSWITDWSNDSGNFSRRELTDTRGQWVLFSEPFLWSGDRRAQLGESLEGLIREPMIECHEANAEELGADRETELKVRVNGTELERPVKITTNPPKGSLFLPWNLLGDFELELYEGSKTYRRISLEKDVQSEVGSS